MGTARQTGGDADFEASTGPGRLLPSATCGQPPAPAPAHSTLRVTRRVPFPLHHRHPEFGGEAVTRGRPDPRSALLLCVFTDTPSHGTGAPEPTRDTR